MSRFEPFRITDLEPCPPWYQVTLPEIEAMVAGLRHCRAEKLLEKENGHRIWAVFAGEQDFPEAKGNWSAAASSPKPEFYKTSGYDPQCVVLAAGVHGSETEGVAAVMNMIALMETGRDLRGKERPKLLELLRQYRVVFLPCQNPDGRALTPDHLRGAKEEDQGRAGQGIWKNGKIIEWLESKQYMPLPLDEVEFPGGYPNEDGINIMHDCAPGALRSKEAAALLSNIEKWQPDLFLNLHSCGGLPEVLVPSWFNYPAHCRRGAELADKVHQVFLDNGAIKALKNPPGIPISCWINFNTAVSMVSGSLAITFEASNHPDFSFDDMLEIHYMLVETMLEDGLKTPFSDRSQITREEFFPTEPKYPNPTWRKV